ncbi:MAG: GPW/gp25 family protein [Algicola sp.]|nr:GPW/gp25 family protein [Algicola sp.]
MTMMQQTDSGWSFPPQFGTDGDNVQLVSGAMQVKQALNLLFMTKIGERLNHPDYGCRLDQYLFEQISAPVIVRIEDTINDAIVEFEPRVADFSIEITLVEDNAFRLHIKLGYILANSDIKDSLSVVLDLQGEEALL